MKIQTQITETVEQVQVIKEVKKQKATVTFDVDQDFIDLINLFGAMPRPDFIRIGGTVEQFTTVVALWNAIHKNPELRNVLDFEYQRGFTMKQQVQSDE